MILSQINVQMVEYNLRIPYSGRSRNRLLHHLLVRSVINKHGGKMIKQGLRQQISIELLCSTICNLLSFWKHDSLRWFHYAVQVVYIP